MSDVVENPLSVPAEVVKNYPEWNCEFRFPQEKLTAGSLWQMQCHGDQDIELKPPLTIQFPKDDQSYALQILEVKNLTPRGGDFLVTGYRPGEHQPPYVVITDYKSAIRVDNLKWKIESVIEQNQAQPPQPFPPYGPFNLSPPWWYQVSFYGVGILVLAILCAALILFLKKQKNQRQLIKLNSALTPYMQFHKNIRGLDMTKDVRSEIEQVIRLYVSRRFQFYAIDLKPKRILAKIKTQLSHDQFESFKNLILELGSLNNQSLDTNDSQQLILMAQNTVDELEKSR